MEKIKQRTRLDWWMGLLLLAVGVLLPLGLVLGIAFDWYEPGEELAIWITAGFTLGLIAAVFFLSYFATYYELGEKGLTVRNLFFYKRFVSYRDILAVQKSVNMVNRPKTWAAPFSVVGIRIDYKKDGNESWFFIAPKNREEFMKQLQERIK